MKVQVEGNLYIESDGMQYIIKEYTGAVNKTGQPLYNTKGYFTSLQFAVKHLVKMKLMESTATNLNDLLQDLKRIESDIETKIGA